MSTTIPTYEAKIIGTDNTGIFAMSFVDYPANEQNFVALKKAPLKLKLDKHKQILTGVVLIPGQAIYRRDDNLGEYFLRFTAEDIEKIAQKMMKKGVALTNTTHQHESNLKGNYLTELWIVTDPERDKSVALGLGQYPAGTLIASYKIESAKYWREEVLTGNVRGFSLEGYFNFKSVQMKKTANKGVQLSAFGLALQKMGIPILMDTVEDTKALETPAAADETASGDPVLIFELQDGGEISVDAEGFATLDGEQAPAGEHALADGNVIVIDDSGMLVVTQPDASSTDPAAAPSAEAVAAAKQRGKEFLAKVVSSNSAEIAKLKAKIAELEKQPSAPPAKPTAEGPAKPVSEMNHTEKLAHILRLKRQARTQ
jgi:Putative phage serine protease XkdF